MRGTNVQERELTVLRAGKRVPAVVWEPSSAPTGVVLLGHGGSGSKRSPRIRRMAHRLVNDAGLAALAIDGPFHGDRVPGVLTAAEYQARIAAEGITAVTERMVADWLAALEAAERAGLLGAEQVAYLGLSMGTRFGLPVAAALGERLRCAVFGKFGLEESVHAMHPALRAPDLIVQAAARIDAPVLMTVQLDDELFPRRGQFELFSAFGATDKTLVLRSGGHAGSSPGDEALWCRFTASRMSGSVR